MVKDLNLRPETVKILEENIGEKLPDIGLGNDFTDMTPKAQATKANTDKWEFIAIKSSAQKRRDFIILFAQVTGNLGPHNPVFPSALVLEFSLSPRISELKGIWEIKCN